MRVPPRPLRAALLCAFAMLLGAGAPALAARSAWDRPVSRRVARDALRGVVQQVRAAVKLGARPIVMVDIDDTVIDGRLRLRVAARSVGLPAKRLVSQTDLYAGLSGPALEEKRASFGALYFNDPALARLDSAQRGASAFLHAVRRAGGRILYVSGRWESTRAVTEQLLLAHGLPLERSSDLFLNPSEQVKASDYKRAIRLRIAEEGRPLAFFDNEAEAVRDYHQAFPAAQAFRLATFRFRDAPKAGPRGVTVLRDFSMRR